MDNQTYDKTELQDAHYDLVSVLYHTLKQAEICRKYKDDALVAGDSELTELFGAIAEESKRQALQLKALLADRIVEDADAEEFDLSPEELEDDSYFDETLKAMDDSDTGAEVH